LAAGADDGRICQERIGDQFPDLLLDQIQPSGFGQIALGQRDHAGFQVQQPQDVQMLTRLRLDRIVRGHDQQGQIHPGRAGQHVPHKTFVARDVDDAQPVLVQQQFGEAQLDGDAPAFFLGKPVGIDPRQGADQRRLAVIDVSGGAKDQVDGHQCRKRLQNNNLRATKAASWPLSSTWRPAKITPFA
jgi:hypothetical protein